MKNAILVLLALSLITACKRKGDELNNKAPLTYIAVTEMNLTGDDRLKSTVDLSWWGSDEDGYVSAFEISLDGTSWTYTEQYDSVFQFEIDAGSDTVDIDFWVRAIDDDSLRDPDPAYLRIPIKNTPPTATIDDVSFPEDSTRLIISFRWNASDPDGDETITGAYLKINEGDWEYIDTRKNLISIVPSTPEATGPVTSQVYYNNEETIGVADIEGLVLNDTNKVYLKVVDLAGTESEVDTSNVVFVKNKTSDLLLVGGLDLLTTAEYSSFINQVYGSFDLEDYGREGSKYQPKFWTPTFTALLSMYDKLVFFSDASIFTNPVSGQKELLLEMASPSIQTFSNLGGKSLITTAFANDQNISSITSTLPIDSLSSASGQAYVLPDSSIYSGSALYPDLQPTLIILGTDPFYHSVDATPIYRAQLAVQAPWVGPDVVGAYRSNNGNINQYFFSVQLHEFNSEPQELYDLFDQILNNDFNW